MPKRTDCKILFSHNKLGPFAMRIKVSPSGVIYRGFKDQIKYPRGTKFTKRVRAAAVRKLCPR